MTREEDFSTTRIRTSLAKAIDEFIHSEEAKHLGFRSRAEFVSEACRNYLDKNMGPVDVPMELLREIDNIVKGKRFGYRSREDFVQDSVRRRLDELKKGVP